MPDQTGKVVLVTGANSGIGFETARVMASHGAEVLLACRNDDVLARLKETTAHDAMAAIRAEHSDAKLHLLELDLASQASIKTAAKRFHDRFGQLDILINNAGVMWLPESKTEDGFETQIGVNCFGHFTLTGLLLPALVRTPGSRVVTLSSRAHLTAKLDVEDLCYGRRKYDPQNAYAQTKLVNLIFARELGRRLEAEGAPTISLAAHPGLASTNLFVGAHLWTRRVSEIVRKGAARLGQSCVEGARSTLYAATMPQLNNGDYIGPNGFLELRGFPGPASSTKVSRDPNVAAALWRASEQATGISYDFRARPRSVVLDAYR